MKVLLRNPRREVDVDAPVRVHTLLARLELPREAHLVIRNGTLVAGDELLAEGDAVEVRPVISGGSS
jgi:sulfur carrier protein